MFSGLKYIFFRYFIFSLVSLISSDILLADTKEKQNIFEDKHYGLSFVIPSSLKKIDDVHPDTLVFLQSKQSEYPTFNILPQVGRYKLEESKPSKLAREAVESYHRVGLTSAKLVSFKQVKIDSQASFQIQITFENDNMSFESEVHIIPRGQEHLICTYIDNDSAFKAQAHYPGINPIQHEANRT